MSGGGAGGVVARLADLARVAVGPGGVACDIAQREEQRGVVVGRVPEAAHRLGRIADAAVRQQLDLGLVTTAALRDAAVALMAAEPEPSLARLLSEYRMLREQAGAPLSTLFDDWATLVDIAIRETLAGRSIGDVWDVAQTHAKAAIRAHVP